jgi:hypothetical protein
MNEERGHALAQVSIGRLATQLGSPEERACPT